MTVRDAPPSSETNRTSKAGKAHSATREGTAGPSREPVEADDDDAPEPNTLAGLVDAHPVATLATALGLGYVLGGGLFTTLTARLVKAGLRLGVQLAVIPALEQGVAGLASTLGETLGGDVDTDHENHEKKPHSGHEGAESQGKSHQRGPGQG